MRLATTSLLVLALALGLAGCSKTADTGAQAECASTEDCADGLQCIDAQCIEVQCTTSSDCPFESYCDTSSYTCLDGCLQDNDCLAGDICDEVARSCVEAECVDTQLDCEVGQLCDPNSGSCVDDTRGHCGQCDYFATGNQCPGGDCWYFELGEKCNNDGQCDPGWSCDRMGSYGKICHRDYCFMTCNENVPNSCPAGFACQQLFTNIPTTYCVADCTYLDDSGYL